MKQKKLNPWALALVIITLLAQGVHGYSAFYHVSQYQGIFGHIQAGLLAMIVVGGVMFFSLYEPPEEKKAIDSIWSSEPDDWLSMCMYLLRVEIVINIYYHGVQIFSNGWQWTDAAIIPVALTLDFTVPFLIYRYSNHIFEKVEKEPKFEPGPDEGFDPKAPFGWNKNGMPKAPYGRRQDGKTPRKTPKK